MRAKTIFMLMLLSAAILLVCAAAPAPSEAQIAGPCGETVTKVCKDVVPGGGRIMKCLNDHRDEQSIACKDWIEDQQKSMRELISVCPEDIARWCGAVPPDKVNIYYCLLDNYISLRLDCRSKLGEIRDRLK